MDNNEIYSSGDFGWREESKENYVIDVRSGLKNIGASENADAEKICSALLSLVNKNGYPKECCFYAYGNKLSLHQEDKKEYYHDGSVQSRKTVRIELTDEATYLEKKAQVTNEKPDAVFLGKEFYDKLDGYFCLRNSPSESEYTLYASDFAGLGYVKITVENEY